MLRALSAGALTLVIVLICTEPYITIRLGIVFSIIASTWIITMPWVFFMSACICKPDIRFILARKRTVESPLFVTAISKELGMRKTPKLKTIAIDKLGASTDGTTIFITNGFEPYLHTKIGRAVIAHELAHIKRKHFVKISAVFTVLFIVSCLFGAQFVELHYLMSLGMGVSAFLTLFAFVIPQISRQMEYQADKLACKVVGSAAMIEALKSVVPTERWGLESDTHPSICARIEKLSTATL